MELSRGVIVIITLLAVVSVSFIIYIIYINKQTPQDQDKTQNISVTGKFISVEVDGFISPFSSIPSDPQQMGFMPTHVTASLDPSLDNNGYLSVSTVITETNDVTVTIARSGEFPSNNGSVSQSYPSGKDPHIVAIDGGRAYGTLQPSTDNTYSWHTSTTLSGPYEEKPIVKFPLTTHNTTDIVVFQKKPLFFAINSDGGELTKWTGDDVLGSKWTPTNTTTNDTVLQNSIVVVATPDKAAVVYSSQTTTNNNILIMLPVVGDAIEVYEEDKLYILNVNATTTSDGRVWVSHRGVVVDNNATNNPSNLYVHMAPNIGEKFTQVITMILKDTGSFTGVSAYIGNLSPSVVGLIVMYITNDSTDTNSVAHYTLYSSIDNFQNEMSTGTWPIGSIDRMIPMAKFIYFGNNIRITLSVPSFSTTSLDIAFGHMDSTDEGKTWTNTIIDTTKQSNMGVCQVNNFMALQTYGYTNNTVSSPTVTQLLGSMPTHTVSLSSIQ